MDVKAKVLGSEDPGGEFGDEEPGEYAAQQDGGSGTEPSPCSRPFFRAGSGFRTVLDLIFSVTHEVEYNINETKYLIEIRR